MAASVPAALLRVAVVQVLLSSRSRVLLGFKIA